MFLSKFLPVGNGTAGSPIFERAGGVSLDAVAALSRHRAEVDSPLHYQTATLPARRRGVAAIRPAREAGFDTERVKRKGWGIAARGGHSGPGVRYRYRLANLCYFGGAGKKRGSESRGRPYGESFMRAEVLEARVGAQEVELGVRFSYRH